jgi:hydrogenase maturation factor HypF (carbamoyltransferase family)
VNRIVRSDLTAGFRSAGLEALLPTRLPPGDGGLSFGQAVVGNIASARAVRPVVAGGSR